VNHRKDDNVLILIKQYAFFDDTGVLTQDLTDALPLEPHAFFALINFQVGSHVFA
jgi:hypothetical protein